MREAVFDEYQGLSVVRPPWHQQWWSAALATALPVFALYPLLALAGTGRPGFFGAVLIAVSLLVVAGYGVYVWKIFLNSQERVTAAVSLVGYVAMTAVAIFIVLNAQLNYEVSVVRRFLTASVILEGVWKTIYISIIAEIVGVILGLFAALGNLARNPLFKSLAGAYIWFFRGTPLLVQLLFWFAALPQIIPQAVNITAFQAAIIGLGVNEGAYMSEIVRAGIQSVDAGQVDAAKSLGMTYPQTMRRIVLPQAMRVIIPPTGNNFISMLKSSSLASAITFEELFRSTQVQIASTFRSLELLTVASLWYLLMTTIFSIFQAGLERHYSSGFRRDGGRPSIWMRLFGNLLPRRGRPA